MSIQYVNHSESLSWSISIFSGDMLNTRVFFFSGETFKVAENAEEHGIN
jgi:hypothetical protein